MNRELLQVSTLSFLLYYVMVRYLKEWKSSKFMDEHMYHAKERDDTIAIGTRIGKKLKQGDIVCLEGPLGAGKTTLVKGIALSLGITEEVTSPTFTIVSSYPGNCNLYHVDLYRIEHIDELYDIGIDDILDGDGIAVIEWGEKIESYLPEQIIKVNISIIKEDNSRNITIQGLEI